MLAFDHKELKLETGFGREQYPVETEEHTPWYEFLKKTCTFNPTHDLNEYGVIVHVLWFTPKPDTQEIGTD